MGSDKELKRLRDAIDGVDAEVVDLLSRRAELAIKVGEVKAESGADVEFYSPERERQVLERIASLNKGPISDKALCRIFREVMSVSLSLEKPLRVAFLGPQATFTHQAAIDHFGLAVEYSPKGDIGEVFDDVERGRVDFGVVPVENSAEGAVTHTLDKFLDSDLKICAEVMLEVSLALLSKDGDIMKIEKVSSYPHAIAQCTGWLKSNLPKAAIVDVSSTAMGAQMASTDPQVAAISSKAAADIYDLRVIEESIQDNPRNFTRFLVIGKKDTTRSGSDKTSLIFATKDAPGALFEMLKGFASRGINLTKIESRPLKTKAWEYVFYVDMDGHLSDDSVKEALAELDKASSFLKILGSYPRSADSEDK